ncbi:MAG: hypothetical protein ABI591_07865 [Kofleriaceae bacterium]
MRWFLVLVLVLVALGSVTVAAPRRATLDIAEYTPLDGWKTTTGGDGVAFAKTSGTDSCLISLQKGRDAVAADFAAELEPTWRAALAALAAETVALPATTFTGTTPHDVAMISTAAATTRTGKPALVFVAILDAGAKVVPVIAVASSAETLKALCAPSIDALVNSITVKATPRKAK